MARNNGLSLHECLPDPDIFVLDEPTTGMDAGSKWDMPSSWEVVLG